MTIRFLIVVLFTLSLPSIAAAELPSFCSGYSAETKEVGDSYKDSKKIWTDLNETYNKASGRKLVVFMDGTANDAKDLTNVRKLYRLSIEHACAGNPVIPYYDKGIGSRWFDPEDGVFGNGASRNIRQAYRFLVEAYKPGDEVYIVGFSRGAFTARSLNGMIEFAGLLAKDSLRGQPEHLVVGRLYETYHRKDTETSLRRRLANVKNLLRVKAFGDDKAHPTKVTVKAVGVFDTVPALGLGRTENPKKHRLALYAEKGFHALSLDEQRKDFKVSRFPQASEVWFPGVHSNIGGGYGHSFSCNGEKDNLEVIPFNWMLSKFYEAKANIFPQKRKYQECVDGRLHDEYFDTPAYRALGVSPRHPEKGDLIHRSVKLRMEVPSLPDPHKEREEGGRYHPNNVTFDGTYTLVATDDDAFQSDSPKIAMTPDRLLD